jgi:hypothetical protein
VKKRIGCQPVLTEISAGLDFLFMHLYPHMPRQSLETDTEPTMRSISIVVSEKGLVFFFSHFIALKSLSSFDGFMAFDTTPVPNKAHCCISRQCEAASILDDTLR